jgi:hypothetical protein
MKCSLLGNYYPMFLNNQGLGTSVYLYQITSPGLSKKCIPLVSLEKISEITKSSDFSATEKNMRSIDVMSTILDHSRENIEEKSKVYLEGFLRKENPVIYGRGPELFPALEMGSDNNIQKSIIVNLRDDLRWKCYHFYPGRYIDVLLDLNHFIVYKLEGDKEGESITMVPDAVYNNLDICLSNPMPVPESCSSITFNGRTKNSDMNRAIKRLEWQSFDM